MTGQVGEETSPAAVVQGIGNMKYYVLQIGGVWKEIKKEDVQSYLDYGCQVKSVDK